MFAEPLESEWLPMTASALDDIPGVGPGRKAALLKAFYGRHAASLA